MPCVSSLRLANQYNALSATITAQSHIGKRGSHDHALVFSRVFQNLISLIHYSEW